MRPRWTAERSPRGVRHPLAAVLGLVFLGLLGRIREFTVLERWAGAHWEQLREALGFERDKPPVGTTISRILAGCSPAQFQEAFQGWLKQVVLSDQPLTAAVDAKTACQGFDAEGQPVQMLTVFVHQLKLVLAQWSVTCNRCALTVLRSCYPPTQPLRARADFIAWNPRLGLELLGLT